MSKLAITVGLPLSGKSTFCNKKIAEGWTVICPDDIRLALYGQQFIKEAEDFVWAICKTTVRALLKRGHSVIIDATNVTKQNRHTWMKMAEEFNILLDVFEFITDVEVCLERNVALGRLDESIILRMHKNREGITPKEGGYLLEYVDGGNNER